MLAKYPGCTKLCIALLLASSSACKPRPQPQTNTVRVAVMERGTVNWEMNTISHHQLDQQHGFQLKAVPFAAGSASKIAFHGGKTDAIVTDWLWVARQRANGRNYLFLPYSKAVGGLIVPAQSTAQKLPDLKLAKIGIAGGPTDKNWLILRAYASKIYNLNLLSETKPVFASPPLIYKAALNGDLHASINYWHFGARMKAAGMREIISVSDAALALGLDPETPMLGFAVKGKWAQKNPELVAGLAKASRNAKNILATNNEEWERLRPMMNARNQNEFIQLREGFRSGIPQNKPVNKAAAAKMLEIMRQFGGKTLLGPVTSLHDEMFIHTND